MKTCLLVLLPLAIVIPQIHTCHVHITRKGNLDYFDYYNLDYDDYTNTSELPVQNSVITCFNISSIAHLPHLHVYKHASHEQFLNITNSNIPTLPRSAFGSFYTITRLYLSHNYVKTIQNGAFDNLTKLQELHLDNNELKEVSNGVFNSLHGLLVLNLANNQILKLDKMALKGVDNLNSLDLSYNRLVKVEEGFLITQTVLEQLNLSGNPLQELVINNVEYFVSLEIKSTAMEHINFNLSGKEVGHLDASQGNLLSVDCALFPKTLDLNLSNNKIVDIAGLSSLKSASVVLNNNWLTKLNGTFCGMSLVLLKNNRIEVLEAYFKNSTELYGLDVGFNKISKIKNDAFEGLLHLNHLSLEYNNIDEIEPKLFLDLRGLVYLNLTHNMIKEIKFGTFDNFARLNVLDISHNKLTHLHKDLFHSMSELTKLHIDNNQISVIDMRNLKTNLPGLMEISLTNNRITCQDLISIKQVLNKYWYVKIVKGDNYAVDNLQGTSCINGNEFDASSKDWSMKKLELEDFFNKKFNSSKYFEQDYSRIEKHDYYKILVFSSIVQIAVSFLILALVSLIFIFLKKLLVQRRSEFSSQIELCSHENVLI